MLDSNFTLDRALAAYLAPNTGNPQRQNDGKTKILGLLTRMILSFYHFGMTFGCGSAAGFIRACLAAASL